MLTRPTATLAVLLAALLATAWAMPSAAQAGGRPRCMGERATIVGTNSPELIKGTRRADVIVAKGGADYILGKLGPDLICAKAGDDHIVTGNGRDKATGGAGDDSFMGGKNTRLLEGGRGDDTFFPNGGTGGRIRGGIGIDWLSFTNRDCHTGVFIDLRTGTAEYRACNDGWSAGTWTLTSITHVDGSSSRDVMVGNENRNVFLGQSGRDTLKGRVGNDTLVGGAGRDVGRGGPGRDSCRGVEVKRSC